MGLFSPGEVRSLAKPAGAENLDTLDDVANASKQLVAVHAGYVPTEREKLRRLRVWRRQEPANAPREPTSEWPV